MMRITVAAAEAQPLHHGDGGIVLAAGGIDARLIAGLPSMRIGSDIVIRASRTPGNRASRPAGRTGRDRPAAPAPMPIRPITMKGAASKPVVSSPSARMMAAPARQRADILEIAEVADLERHQRELLLDRNFLADRRPRQTSGAPRRRCRSCWRSREPARRHSRRRCRPAGSSNSAARWWRHPWRFRWCNRQCRPRSRCSRA